MDYPKNDLTLWFSNEIYSAVTKLYPEVGLEITHITDSISTPNKEFGDLSSSVPIRIAKHYQKKPADVSEEIIKNMGKNAMVRELRGIGGYINLFINEAMYSHEVIESAISMGKRYGSVNKGDGKRVLVESPAVNPTKPWHIGHLRNALLGDAISNILEFCNYFVEREDYIDDLGLQVAEILWGQKNMESDPDKKFDQWLGEQYVEINKRLNSEGVNEDISGILKKMESGNSEESKAARDIAFKCVEAQYETSKSYGIFHDVMIWESDIVMAKLLEMSIEMGLSKNVFEKSDSGKNKGCIVVNLDKMRNFARDFENPNEHEKVLVRSDGTATYVAKDIAFHMWKLGILDFKFKYKEMSMQSVGKRLYSTSEDGVEMDFGNAYMVINVIGSAQRYTQLILKSVLSMMGYEKKAEKIKHLAYGEVGIEGGSLSGRTGGWLGNNKAYTADVLLDEARSKALEATEKSKKIEHRNKIPEIANAIGISAIKFEFLKVSAEKPFIFSWNSALNFEGNSGPYCMYSYARAKRILEKCNYSDESIDAIEYEKVTRGKDFDLVKLIADAHEVVEKACEELRPNIIADYIIEITMAFSRFYESVPVMNSNAKELRCRIVSAYVIVVGNMLGLLGIQTVDSM